MAEHWLYQAARTWEMVCFRDEFYWHCDSDWWCLVSQSPEADAIDLMRGYCKNYKLPWTSGFRKGS